MRGWVYGMILPLTARAVNGKIAFILQFNAVPKLPLCPVRYDDAGGRSIGSLVLHMNTPVTKPARLIDVAQRASVSRIVAGQVLLGSGGKTTRVSEATIQRVRKAAAELDYRPNLVARQLSGIRTKTLAALIGVNRYAVHYDRLRAIDREADRRGYRLMVGYLHGEGDQLTDDLYARLDEMLRRGVDAVILMHAFNDLPPKVVSRFNQTKFITCQMSPALPDAFHVDVDIADGVEQLVDHLYQRGRRRLALLLDGKSTVRPSQRLAGFTGACKRLGISGSSMIWSAGVTNDIADPAEIRAHVDRVLDAEFDRSKCDAILASNDQWAVQTVKALIDRGVKVPGDVAVTGVDNVDIAEACIPALTTIDFRNDHFAATLMDTLDALIAGRPAPADNLAITVKPQLVVRQST